MPIACLAEEKALGEEETGLRFGSLWHGVPEGLCIDEDSSLEKLLFSIVKQKKQPRGCFNVREISTASVQLEYKRCPGRLRVSVRSR